LRPSGARRNLHELADDLGLTPPAVDMPNPGPQEGRTAPIAPGPMQSVDLTDHPAVLAAIGEPVTKAGGAEDRSETCFQIVAAAVKSGLTLAQTEWAARQRPSVAERLAEHPEDVRRCWDKAIDTDQRRRLAQRQEREALTVLAPKKASDRPQLWRAGELQGIKQSKFLAAQRIPYGAATILCGDEGIGKSLLWVLVVAAVTTGRALPALGIPERAPADVILVLTEDNWAEDVLPRLTVAGADIDRISVICTEDDGTGSPVFPDNMDLITEAEIRPTLVVVDAWLDTVPGHLSVKDTQQSRAALHPWKEVAGKTGAAILLLTHTNRLGTGNLRDKYGASAALRQKARLTLFAMADPDDGTLVVGPDKANNTAGGTHASRFRILGEQFWPPTPDHDGTVPSLQHLGSTGKSIKQHWVDALAAAPAEDWLQSFLADGKRAAADIFETGEKAEGFSKDQLKRAKTRLGVHTSKVSDTNGELRWYWELANDTEVSE
jgi:AAA domain